MLNPLLREREAARKWLAYLKDPEKERQRKRREYWEEPEKQRLRKNFLYRELRREIEENPKLMDLIKPGLKPPRWNPKRVYTHRW